MTEPARPEWVEEMESHLHQSVGGGTLMPKPVDLTPITDFSTLFAEYQLKGKDLLVHLFPRLGAEDLWHFGGVRGGRYIPARREEDIGARFPEDITDKIKAAADKVWQGDVSITESKVLRYPEGANIEKDEPEEVSVGSFAVQFLFAKQTTNVVGVEKFMDQFCEELDALLEPQ